MPGPISSQGTGRLSGPPPLVQIVAVTEIVHPPKSRLYKLKLSDGERVVSAVAYAPSASSNLGFYDLQLGYKVCRSHSIPTNFVMKFCEIDAAQMPASTKRRDCPAGAEA